MPVVEQNPDPNLARIATEAVGATVTEFQARKLNADQLGITILELNRSKGSWIQGDARGNEAMYPASVVKLFFLAYAEYLRHRSELDSTPELERAIVDMIVESNNDATAQVVDVITGTTGGPSLPPNELSEWQEKRQVVNKWFKSRGYLKVNACQKTWNEGPYGRERQGYGPNFELRNSLTPNACARLLGEIAMDRAVSPDRDAAMRKLLSRKIPADGPGADSQSTGFTGRILPKGSQLWSKAGWTSTVSHDLAWVKVPDGREFVLALFSKDHATAEGLIPFMARECLSRLGVKELGDPFAKKAN